MIYPRLFLARNLLRQDGVIFVSIDDNEVANLRKIMDEIFGEENFVAEIPRITKKAWKSSTDISKNHDYVLIYKRDVDLWSLVRIKHTDLGFKNEDEFIEQRGKYKLNQTLDYGSIQYSKSLDYEITLEWYTFRPGGVSQKEMLERQAQNPDTDFCWRWSEKLFQFGLENWFIVIKEGKNWKRIYTKTYQLATISEDENGYYVDYQDRDKALSSLDLLENEFSNDNSKKDIKKVLGKSYFDYTKPVQLMKELVQRWTSSSENDIVLDFFAGSGTTAHAVMALNAEDGGNRKWICVQLPEKCKPESEASKAGFATIAHISRERIRRAGKKIGESVANSSPHPVPPPKEEGVRTNQLDLGFRAFRLDASNFKVWNTQVENVEQLEQQMIDFVDNVRSDTTSENLLYELIIKSGYDLNVPLETKKTSDGDYHRIAGGELVICIADTLTRSLFDAIIADKPQKIITLDRAFAGNDQLKTNMVLMAEQEGVKEFKVI
jgi:adenine-specific DNA-methyltransferase